MSRVKHLRLLIGTVLLALTLVLSGCGGDPQEEQQDVEEAQQQVEEEQKDVEEARDEQQEEQPQDPQRDKEKNEEQ